MAYFLGRNKNMIYSKFSLLRQFLASEGQYWASGRQFLLWSQFLASASWFWLSASRLWSSVSKFWTSGSRFLALKVDSGPGVEFWSPRVEFIPLRVDFGLWGSILGLYTVSRARRDTMRWSTLFFTQASNIEDPSFWKPPGSNQAGSASKCINWPSSEYIFSKIAGYPVCTLARDWY